MPSCVHLGGVTVISTYLAVINILLLLQQVASGINIATVQLLQMSSMPSGLANPNLTWETSDQLDFGLDLRLFNDALTISMDYYKKTTKDLLVDAPCLPETGDLHR